MERFEVVGLAAENTCTKHNTSNIGRTRVMVMIRCAVRLASAVPALQLQHGSQTQETVLLDHLP